LYTRDYKKSLRVVDVKGLPGLAAIDLCHFNVLPVHQAIDYRNNGPSDLLFTGIIWITTDQFSNA